jgi:hypothetical protein
VLTAPILLGIASALATLLLDWLHAKPRVPRWFGFIKLTYVRTAAAGVFTLTAAAGISLSISDHSHHTVSYIGWYGGAVLALAVIVATTVIIDRVPMINASGDSSSPPPTRAPVSQTHEQQLKVVEFA